MLLRADVLGRLRVYGVLGCSRTGCKTRSVFIELADTKLLLAGVSTCVCMLDGMVGLSGTSSFYFSVL